MDMPVSVAGANDQEENYTPPLPSPTARRRSWMSADGEVPAGEEYRFQPTHDLHFRGDLTDFGEYTDDVPGRYSNRDVHYAKYPYIYEVHFKRTKDLYMGGHSHVFLTGDFVLVEADRGEDLGVISRAFAPHDPSYPMDASPRHSVISLASDQDKMDLMRQAQDEDEALAICRDFAARRRMKITVLDAEYQFDRRKLTFLFVSDKHADFRELVRDLFSLFNTRIWMQKINPAQVAALQLDGIHVQQLQHQPRAREPAQRLPVSTARPVPPPAHVTRHRDLPMSYRDVHARSSHHSWSVVGDKIVYHDGSSAVSDSHRAPGYDMYSPASLLQTHDYSRSQVPVEPDFLDPRDQLEYNERHFLEQDYARGNWSRESPSHSYRLDEYAPSVTRHIPSSGYRMR
ncbi:unnamed protein product [Symbiodinium microadriaticum]|nr:unnamed protein product [Symbiodinium microadriaticum]